MSKARPTQPVTALLRHVRWPWVEPLPTVNGRGPNYQVSVRRAKGLMHLAEPGVRDWHSQHIGVCAPGLTYCSLCAPSLSPACIPETPTKTVLWPSTLSYVKHLTPTSAGHPQFVNSSSSSLGFLITLSPTISSSTHKYCYGLNTIAGTLTYRRDYRNSYLNMSC